MGQEMNIEHVDLEWRGGRDGISAALDGIPGPASKYALLMQYSIFYTYRLNQPTTSAQTQSVIFTTNQPFLNMEMHLRIQPEI